MLEVPVRPSDRGHNYKCIIKLPDDPLEISDLPAVDHTDQKALVCMRVHSPCRQDGTAVMKLAHQRLRELLRLRCDNLELGGGPCALEDQVPDPGCDKAVDYAQDDRNIVHSVGEERDSGNSHVDSEHQPDKVYGRLLVDDKSCHDIQAARASAKTDGDAVVESAEHACGNSRHDPLSPVVSMKHQRGQVQVPDQYAGNREHYDIDERADHVFPAAHHKERRD